MHHSKHTPSAVRAFGAALFDHGLRVREECNELVFNQRDFELRINAAEQTHGHALRSFVSVAEERLAPGSLVLFNEISLEGYPVVAFGAGRGQVTFEFAWFHPTGADWRISAERCQGLVDRVVGSFAPSSASISTHSSESRPAPKRMGSQRRLVATGGRA